MTSFHLRSIPAPGAIGWWGRSFRGERGAAATEQRIRLLTGAIGIILLLSSAPACGQSVPAPIEAPTTGENLLRYSLQIEVPVSVRRDLQAAAEALDRGNIPVAVAEWQQVLRSEAGAGLIPLGDSLVAPADALRRLLPNMPPEFLAEWERATAKWADGALRAARSANDPALFQQVARRAVATPWGRQAGVEWAGRSFDAGQPQECAAACAWLLDGPTTDTQLASDSPVALWWIASLEQLGDRESALDVWSRFHTLIPSAVLGEARHDPRLGLWLKDFPEQSALIRNAEEDLPVSRIGEILPARLSADERLAPIAPASESVLHLMRDFELIAHPLLMLSRPEGASVSFTRGPIIQALDAAQRTLGESLMLPAISQGAFTYQFDSGMLTAIETATGVSMWSAAERHGQLLAEPLIRKDAIVVLTQDEADIRVTALKLEDGSQIWSTRLGSEGIPRQFDPRRQWMPARGISIGQEVVWATGAGAAASLDALTGRIAWVHRVPREDWRDAGPPLAPVAPHAPRIRLWAGWRSRALWQEGDVLVWCSPEGDQLLGLDRRTGETRWTRPRGEGLSVQHTPGRLVILESHALRGLDPVDGSEIWSVATPPIAGEGFVERGWIVVPLRSGGTIAVRLGDGAFVRAVDWNREVTLSDPPQSLPRPALRSLSRMSDGIRIQDVFGGQVVPTVAASTPDQTTPAQLAAAGRLEEAFARLESDPEVSPDSAGALLAATRLRLIQRDCQASTQTAAPTSPAPLPDLTNFDGPDRLQLALLQWRLQPSIESSAALLAAACEVETDEQIDLPGRRVRLDAAAAGWLLHRPEFEARDAPLKPGDLQELPADVVRALDRAIEEFEKHEESAALDRLLTHLLGTVWGAERFLSRCESQSGPIDELPLRARIACDLQLARLARVSGPLGERAARLRKQFQIPVSVAEHWPEEPPLITVRRWNSSISTRPIERIPVAQGATDRLQAEIDFRNGRPRFSGAGEDRPWSPEELKPERSLHVLASAQRAWLLGSMVVFQAGTRVLGISPFGTDGRRGAEYLWPIDPPVDTWGTASSFNVGFLARVGDASPGAHLPDLDEFGRPLSQVGPVTSTYVALRQFGRLALFETATGRPLWTRDGYARDAVACGDEGAIVLLSPGRADVVSPLDGQTLGHWSPDFGPADVLELRGRTILVWKAAADSASRELRAVDGVTGQVLWSVPGGSEAHACVAGAYAMIVNPGELRVVEIESGTVASTIEIETPQDLAAAAAIADEHGVLVLVSGPPALAQARQTFQATGGHRRPFANGRLIGLDPGTLSLRWSIPFDKTVFALDQASDVPLLVINDAVYDESIEDTQVALGRLQCYDKRTGELLYEATSDQLGRVSPVIERDPARKLVEVRTSKAIVRFDYSGTPPETSP